MKKLAAPLQAFAALFLCAGMAWMIFVLASINPTPPTAADLQARSTQDLSFADMNSTAVALAQQMLENMVPSPVHPFFMPVTGRETVTPTPTVAVTLKPVYTLASSPISTVYSISPTSTRKKRDTEVPVATQTSIPAKTLRPPTATATATQVPTKTKLPTLTPMPTQTQLPTPTDQPTAQPSSTPAPPEPPTPVPPTPTDSYP
jgi:hypothetical protein